MNIYVLENVDRAEQVAAVLMGPTRPDLEQLLGPRDLMVHLGIGIDWAFAVLVVHSRVDVESELTDLLKEQLRVKKELARREWRARRPVATPSDSDQPISGFAFPYRFQERVECDSGIRPKTRKPA
jgi:hypothetical protein